MALEKNELIKLAKSVANGSPSTTFSHEGQTVSYQAANELLRQELRNYASTYAQYRANKNLIFELIETIIDDYLPKKVMEQYGQFAEVKVFNQGDKPIFVQKITTAAKRRAKKYITRVGLNGIYEVFRLDGKTLEVTTSAWGGAAQIGFEEFLDGRVDFADVLDILNEGLDEVVYKEIEKSLKAAATTLTQANRVSKNAFVEADMDRLLAIADSYGQGVIYCTYEFAATMVPQNGWVSDEMRNTKWQNGYLGNYKGHKVIVLNQSFEDETNSKKVIDPSYAWIIPTGVNDKPVKIALEGNTIVREIENADMSREIQCYKKMGVGTMITNNICVYINTSLKMTDTL